MKADLAASIHARLSARAKARDEVFQDVLTRYGVERFLYRLSRTPARDTLLPKLISGELRTKDPARFMEKTV